MLRRGPPWCGRCHVAVGCVRIRCRTTPMAAIERTSYIFPSSISSCLHVEWVRVRTAFVCACVHDGTVGQWPRKSVVSCHWVRPRTALTSFSVSLNLILRSAYAGMAPGAVEMPCRMRQSHGHVCVTLPLIHLDKAWFFPRWLPKTCNLLSAFFVPSVSRRVKFEGFTTLLYLQMLYDSVILISRYNVCAH